MITHTPQYFEHGIEKTLVVDGFGEVDVSKVARVGFVVNVAHARIVCSAVHWLAVDLGFVAGYTWFDFAAVYC